MFDNDHYTFSPCWHVKMQKFLFNFYKQKLHRHYILKTFSKAQNKSSTQSSRKPQKQNLSVPRLHLLNHPARRGLPDEWSTSALTNPLSPRKRWRRHHGNTFKTPPDNRDHKAGTSDTRNVGQPLNKGRVQRIKEYLRQMDISVWDPSITRKVTFFLSFHVYFVLFLSLSPHTGSLIRSSGSTWENTDWHIMLNHTSSSSSRLLASSAHLWSSSWIIRAYLQSSSSLINTKRMKTWSHIQSRQMIKKIIIKTCLLIKWYSLY